MGKSFKSPGISFSFQPKGICSARVLLQDFPRQEELPKQQEPNCCQLKASHLLSLFPAAMLPIKAWRTIPDVSHQAQYEKNLGRKKKKTKKQTNKPTTPNPKCKKTQKPGKQPGRDLTGNRDESRRKRNYFICLKQCFLKSPIDICFVNALSLFITSRAWNCLWSYNHATPRFWLCQQRASSIFTGTLGIEI